MEAHVEILLLKLIGSAAVASAIVVAAMAIQISRKLADRTPSLSDTSREKPHRNFLKFWLR